MAEEQFLINLTSAFSASLAEAIGQGVARAVESNSRQLQTFARNFARNVGNTSDLVAVHERVGELARDSVKRSYDQLITAREGWAARQHYRRGATDWQKRRFAGGVLRRAFNDEEFFTATADGILFVNTEMLNRKAAQWKRLAFGAGAAGESVREEVPIRFGAMVVASMSFDEGPSPGFVVPRGVWVGPGGPVRAGSMAAGSDMFFPASEARAAGFGRNITRFPRRSRGIEGRNFFNAGLRRIARELPVAYEGLVDKWWAQAEGSVPTASQVTVTARAVRGR